MSTDQFNIIISVLAVVGQILVIVLVCCLIFFRKSYLKFFADNSIPLAFFVALLATGGSLYYSEIAKLAPCDLCWFQRIFIYPQVVLLGLAWFKKEKYIIDYSLAMIAIGTIFSVYHNYIYYTFRPSNFCSIASPCTQQYVVGFNYLSIPLLALTTLVLMGLLLLGHRITKK